MRNSIKVNTPTVHLFLDREDKLGNRYVLVRVTQFRKSRKISTGVKCKAAHFHIAAKAGLWLDKREEGYMEKNTEISRTLERLKVAIESSSEVHGSAYAEDVMNLARIGTGERDFFEYFLAYAEGCQWTTRAHYKTIYNHLKRCTAHMQRTTEDKVRLTCKHIDLSFLEAYKKYLEGRALDSDTMRSHFKKIKTVVTNAQNNGVVFSQHNVFKGFTIPKKQLPFKSSSPKKR